MNAPLRTIAVAVALGLALPGAVVAQEPDADAPPRTSETPTREDVQREADEAIAAVQSYTAARRLAAQERAREAVERMRERMARTQEEWMAERLRIDEALRARRVESMAAARELLDRAQQRSRELEAASEADWQRARERFVDSYRKLSAGVQGLVERSMPGRPVPPPPREDPPGRESDEPDEVRPGAPPPRDDGGSRSARAAAGRGVP